MYREDMDEPSKVEQAVQRAEENYENGLEVPKEMKFYKMKTPANRQEEKKK